MVSSYIKRGITGNFWESIVKPAVLKRDNYKCIKCVNKKDLEVHETDHKNITFNTLQTLCNLCHRKEHTHYNIKKNDRIKRD
ncbi:MAG TPA: hypothetical protein ENH85_01685 [Candidatus Scalindua sp.]|nr:hypothetical protein [Candidatus Scalindua sp.]